VNNFFIVFVHPLNEPGPPMVYRGDGGNVVVYNNRPEAGRGRVNRRHQQEPELFLYRYRVPALMTEPQWALGFALITAAFRIRAAPPPR
jgi:hypothetical protein